MYQSPTPATKLYLRDILKTTPLTRSEEQELFGLYLKGNERARARLVKANMRFVLKVAQQYRLSPIPLPDLVSIGAMGLIRALESFDPTRGLKFISYAVWWIKVYITRSISEQGTTIRLPAHKYNKVKIAHKNRAAGKRIDGETQELMQLTERGLSLEARMENGSGTPFSEMFADDPEKRPDNITMMRSAEKFTRELLAELPEREAVLLRSIYGIDSGSPKSLSEVSEGLSISKERTRQLRDKAIKLIRHGRHRHVLRERFQELAEAA